jgi:hypothetical protein
MKDCAANVLGAFATWFMWFAELVLSAFARTQAEIHSP